jgi:hypothetical protein
VPRSAARARSGRVRRMSRRRTFTDRVPVVRRYIRDGSLFRRDAPRSRWAVSVRRVRQYEFPDRDGLIAALLPTRWTPTLGVCGPTPASSLRCSGRQYRQQGGKTEAHARLSQQLEWIRRARPGCIVRSAPIPREPTTADLFRPGVRSAEGSVRMKNSDLAGGSGTVPAKGSR